MSVIYDVRLMVDTFIVVVVIVLYQFRRSLSFCYTRVALLSFLRLL